jgi:ribosome-associated translation inhibitor RaiA
MKYNITNLDEFKVNKNDNHKGITQDVEQFNIMGNIFNDVSEKIRNLIEEKIKELIKPYVNVETNNFEELKKELTDKKYELTIEEYMDHKEYIIKHIPTGKSDYFKEIYRIDSESKKEYENYTHYGFTTYISGVVRNIKR